jgi:hypothetical protein
VTTDGRKLPRRGPKPRTSLSLIPVGAPKHLNSLGKQRLEGRKKSTVLLSFTRPSVIVSEKNRTHATRAKLSPVPPPPLTRQATIELANDGRGKSQEDLKTSIRRISALEDAFDFERDRLMRARLVAMAAMHGGDPAAIAAAPERVFACRDQLRVSSGE